MKLLVLLFSVLLISSALSEEVKNKEVTTKIEVVLYTGNKFIRIPAGSLGEIIRDYDGLVAVKVGDNTFKMLKSDLEIK